MMQKAPHANCENCPLKDRPFVSPDGPIGADLIVIGDGPGYEDVKTNLPFSGKGGDLLKKAFSDAGQSWDQIYKTHVVLCRPLSREGSEPEAVEACSDRLARELETVQAPSILCLSDSAAESVHQKDASKLRSQWLPFQGKDWISTFAPDFVLKVPGKAFQFDRDLRRAIRGPIERIVGKPPTIHHITTQEELENALEGFVQAGVPVAYDVEIGSGRPGLFNGLSYWDTPTEPKARLLCLAMTNRLDEAWIVNEELLKQPKARKALNLFFPKLDTCAHNGKFDQLHLRANGIEAHTDFDTMGAHYILHQEMPHGLKDLATSYFDVEDYEEKYVIPYVGSNRDKRDYSLIPYDILAQYGGWDVTICLALKTVLERELKGITFETPIVPEGITTMYEWPFQNVWMRLHRALVDIEWRGIKIDRDHLEFWKVVLENEKFSYLNQVRDMVDKPELNVGSTQQMWTVLFEDLGLPKALGLKKDKKTKQLKKSTDKEVLFAVDDFLEMTKEIEFVFAKKVVRVLRLYRRIDKILGTYIHKLLIGADVNNRYHPSFRSTTVETGRLAEEILLLIPRGTEKDPEIARIGSIIKAAFIAEDGNLLVGADLSQAEIRTGAILSGDPFLLNVYELDLDVHAEVAEAAWGERTGQSRTDAKSVVFGTLFGGLLINLLRRLGTSADRIPAIQERLVDKLAGYFAWAIETRKKAVTTGLIQTRFGYRRRFPVRSTSKDRDTIEKASVNTPIQNGPAILTELAICELVERGVPVVLSVHDSIMCEVPLADSEAVGELTKEILESYGNLHFPGVRWKADVGPGKPRWKTSPKHSLLGG